MRNAIFNEIFLDLYSKWGRGVYLSHRGVLEIKTMNADHIRNAIVQLKKKREIRLVSVMSLDDDGDIVSEIKSEYANQKDLISCKIDELEVELKTRKL